MELSNNEINFKILFIDLAGHGRSTNFQSIEDYSFISQSKVVNNIINKEFGEKIKYIAIGHCYGSFIAIKLASLYPDRVNDLVLISSNPFHQKHRKLMFKLVHNKITRNSLKLLFRKYNLSKLSENFDYDAFRDSSDYNIQRIFIDIKNTSLKGYFASLYNLLFSPIYDDFENLLKTKRNILMIHGEKDRVFSFNIVKKQAELQDIKFIGIPNTNHLPVFNAVDPLAEIIFLEVIIKQ